LYSKQHLPINHIPILPSSPMSSLLTISAPCFLQILKSLLGRRQNQIEMASIAGKWRGHALKEVQAQHEYCRELKHQEYCPFKMV
jgi:hypothetical protein